MTDDRIDELFEKHQPGPRRNIGRARKFARAVIAEVRYEIKLKERRALYPVVGYINKDGVLTKDRVRPDDYAVFRFINSDGVRITPKYSKE